MLAEEATCEFFTVKVNLTFERDGERVAEETRVVYRAFTDEVIEQIAALPETQRGMLTYQLPIIVKELPDLKDAKGQQQKPTVEYFKRMAPINKRAIEKAIDDDQFPK